LLILPLHKWKEGTVIGKVVRQGAPAVISRGGLPLPTVTVASSAAVAAAAALIACPSRNESLQVQNDLLHYHLSSQQAVISVSDPCGSLCSDLASSSWA